MKCKIVLLLTTISLLSLMLTGCSSSSPSQKNDDKDQLTAIPNDTVTPPNTVIAGKTAIYTINVSTGLQTMKVGNTTQSLHITGITLPTGSAVATLLTHKDTVGPNGDCWHAINGIGATLTQGQSCTVEYEVTGQDSATLTTPLIIHTSNNTITQQPNIIFSNMPVGAGSISVNSAETKLIIHPGFVVKIPVTAVGSSLNNLQLDLPGYLKSLIDSGYANTSLSVANLAQGEQHTFEFKLKSSFSPALTAAQIEQLDHNLTNVSDLSSAPVIGVSAANLNKTTAETISYSNF